MNLLKSFFVISLLFLLIVPASAQTITFSDLNLNSRHVSIYSVNGSGTTLLSSGSSSNLTVDLSPDNTYQIVIKPDRNTWFDDPRNAIQYFISDATGQTLTFLIFALMFGGIIRIVFR